MSRGRVFCQVTSYLSPEEVAEVDDACTVLGETRAEFIRQALRVYLAEVAR